MTRPAEQPPQAQPQPQPEQNPVPAPTPAPAPLPDGAAFDMNWLPYNQGTKGYLAAQAFLRGETNSHKIAADVRPASRMCRM
jgi:hypothetical protein